MNNWDKRFLDMAKLVSTWSKDPSTKVGAVIVDSKNRVVSIGFNGLPVGVNDSDEILQNRELKYRMILHAEENAIHFATGDIEGSTIYTYPLPPCIKCSSSIIQRGIKRVVSYSSSVDRWKAEFDQAKEMYDEVGIDLMLYTEEESENEHCKS